MDLYRAGGLLITTAASTLVLSGCRGRHAPQAPRISVPAASAVPVSTPGSPSPSVTDLAAYARGRSREVALMRAALAWLQRADGDSTARRAAALAASTVGVEREGASAAGLRPEAYHTLVLRVDSLLLSRGRSRPVAAADSPAASVGGGGSTWRALDSLRVELAVLRSRFIAASEDDTP